MRLNSDAAGRMKDIRGRKRAAGSAFPVQGHGQMHFPSHGARPYEAESRTDAVFRQMGPIPQLPQIEERLPALAGAPRPLPSPSSVGEDLTQTHSTPDFTFLLHTVPPIDEFRQGAFCKIAEVADFWGVGTAALGRVETSSLSVG